MNRTRKSGTRIYDFFIAGLLGLALLTAGAGQIGWSGHIARADGAPTVISTIPADNDINIPVGTDIEVTFSESMNATATQGAFSLPGVIGSFSWVGENITMIFNPDADLDPGMEYTASISTNATSMAGDSLATFQWSFTTINVVSVTISDNGDTGLSFSSPNPGTDKQPEVASPSITITAGTENTADVDIYLKGTDFARVGGGGAIGIDKAFWKADSNDPNGATLMTASYASVTTLAAGTSVNIYHWLSIPNGTPAGSYSSTFTYKTDEA